MRKKQIEKCSKQACENLKKVLTLDESGSNLRESVFEGLEGQLEKMNPEDLKEIMKDLISAK